MTTAVASKLPKADNISETLAMLFGEEEIAVNPGRDVKVERTALYTTDAGDVVAAIECDRAFTVFTSAKLVMVPAGRAKELAGSDEQANNIDEAFDEIANIAATWFQRGRDERTSLASVEMGESSQVEELSRTAVFVADVPGYGVGTVRVRTLPS